MAESRLEGGAYQNKNGDWFNAEGEEISDEALIEAGLIKKARAKKTEETDPTT